MRDLDVLQDLVCGGKAINAAEVERVAHANDIIVRELGGEGGNPLGGDIETYEQLTACIIRILGLAAPVAAAIINPKKIVPQDVGQWVLHGDDKLSGRKGWEISGWQHNRLWLYQGEQGYLAQQRHYPGVRRLILEAAYRPNGSMVEAAWEIDPKNQIEVGPYNVTNPVMSYARYCSERRAAESFFAFCERADVLDLVSNGVEQQLARLSPSESTTDDRSI